MLLLFASSDYVHVRYIYSTIFNVHIAGSRINLSAENFEIEIRGGNVCISLCNQIAREQRMKYRAATWRVEPPGIPSTSSLFFFFLTPSPPPFLRLSSPFVAGARAQTESLAARPLYIIIKFSLSLPPAGVPAHPPVAHAGTQIA